MIMPRNLCVNSVAEKNQSRTYENEGIAGVPLTGYTISNKHFHYNDTHKTSFVMVEQKLGEEFVEGIFYYHDTILFDIIYII